MFPMRPVIKCLILMNNFQKKTKYRVKFDKGARGLLSSNHIALESNPHPSVLNVGSRVVGKSEALSHLYIYLEQGIILFWQKQISFCYVLSLCKHNLTEHNCTLYCNLNWLKLKTHQRLTLFLHCFVTVIIIVYLSTDICVRWTATEGKKINFIPILLAK